MNCGFYYAPHEEDDHLKNCKAKFTENVIDRLVTGYNLKDRRPRFPKGKNGKFFSPVEGSDFECENEYQLLTHICFKVSPYLAFKASYSQVALARQFLWQQGYDYDHGTGHGVGCFLNVHEGPHRIGKGANNVPLQPGMVVSNEPGYYKQDGYGIRCANLIYVADKGLENDGKKFYQFETLTLVPFDLNLIEPSLLTQEEVSWINSYHAEVKAKISPLLTGDDVAWLTQATRTI